MYSFAKILLWITILQSAAFVFATDDSLANMISRTLANADGIVPTTQINRKLRFTRGSEGTRPVRLTKRFPFSAGRDEWCGEMAEDPATDFSASAPSAADCRTLANSLDNQNGFWTLQPSDFASDGWARVVSSGTCSFAVTYADTGSTSAAGPMRIGTNDIRFYITRYEVLGKDGKLGLQGIVQCYNSEKMIFVNWGLIHS